MKGMGFFKGVAKPHLALSKTMPPSAIMIAKSMKYQKSGSYTGYIHVASLNTEPLLIALLDSFIRWH